MKATALVLLLGLLTVSPHAQTPAHAPIASRVDLVPLEVCVREGDGRFVARLGPQDFVVLENRVPQRIQFFEAEGQVPLAVALLIDSSSSMAGRKIERAKAAAQAFVRHLRPGDLIEIVTFNEQADRRYPLGADHTAAAASIVNVSARGRTGLYAAILAALHDLARAQVHARFDHRGVLLIFSDGQDTSSLPTFEDVREDVRRSGVAVYVVSLRTDRRGRWLAPPHELARLASESGGRAIAARDPARMADISEEISVELRHFYRLAYVPQPGSHDGSWRSISVSVRGHEQAEVRARSGYYAPRAGRSGR